MKCKRTVYSFSTANLSHEAHRHPVGCPDYCPCMGSKNDCACKLCVAEKAKVSISHE